MVAWYVQATISNVIIVWSSIALCIIPSEQSPFWFLFKMVLLAIWGLWIVLKPEITITQETVVEDTTNNAIIAKTRLDVDVNKTT